MTEGDTMTETKTTPARVEAPSANGTEPTVDTRPLGRRWLAVLDRIGDLEPDKTHPHHKFRYVSIQKLSSALRKACIAEGVFYWPSVRGDQFIVRIENADDERQVRTSAWPVFEDDKGFAYTVKYPLARVTLMGDEADDQSEQQLVPPRPKAHAAQAERRPGAMPPAPTAPAPASPSAPGAAEYDLTVIRELASKLQSDDLRDLVRGAGMEAYLAQRGSGWVLKAAALTAEDAAALRVHLERALSATGLPIQ